LAEANVVNTILFDAIHASMFLKNAASRRCAHVKLPAVNMLVVGSAERGWTLGLSPSASRAPSHSATGALRVQTEFVL
jgi:hypothetical protein